MTINKIVKKQTSEALTIVTSAETYQVQIPANCVLNLDRHFSSSQYRQPQQHRSMVSVDDRSWEDDHVAALEPRTAMETASRNDSR